MLNLKQRTMMFERFQAENPHPETELIYHTPFELLIAVVLSAQATDKGVNKATQKLFPVANTPQAILDLGLEGLKSYINTINFYNNKAKHILQACEILVTKYHGEIPFSREVLESLPGVGRKTANVILNVAFQEPTMAVDTHIFRVSNRTGLAPGKTPREVEDGLLKRVPKPFLQHAHHWLVLHGRYVCLARKPRCESCLISDICQFDQKTES